MRSDGIAKILLLLLLIAVTMGAIISIQALERARMVNLQALKTLERVEKRLLETPDTPKTGDDLSRVPVANAEFYLKNVTPGGTLREAISAEPPSLNPLISNEATAAALHALCVPPLAERSYDRPDGDFKPMIAESWQVSDDHLSYHIRLRKNVKWDAYTDPVDHRRVPAKRVTAGDFLFFVEVLQNPEVNCAPIRSYYQDLDGIEVINDFEFIVKWKRPFYGSLPATLGMTPLPRHYFTPQNGKFDGKLFNDDHRRNAFIVGCGAYRFEKWEKNRRLIFRRNREYFGIAGGAAPAVEERIFEVIQLPNTRFQALAAGKLDMLNLSTEQWVRRSNDTIFTSKAFSRYRSPALSYAYIGYNQRSVLFQDRRVRQALTMLTDRERIIRDVLHGLAIPIKSPFPANSLFSNPALKPLPYAPQEAKKLLAEAGWSDRDGDGIIEKDGRKFSFTMLQIANHPTQSKIFPMLKESFGLAGIEMKIQTLEWSVYLERLESRNYDACSLGWTTNFDPDPYQVWHSQGIPAPGSNHISYANKELDRCIEELRRCFDRKKRIALARRIEKIIHDDQPYTFLYTPYSLTAVSNAFTNIRLFPTGVEPRIFADKKNLH